MSELERNSVPAANMPEERPDAKHAAATTSETNHTETESTLFSAPSTPPRQGPGKKRVKTLVLTLCALVVLGGGMAGAYFGGLFTPTEGENSSLVEESETHLPPLADYSKIGTSAIKKITVKNETGHYTLVPSDTGAMAIEGMADLPRDASAVDALLTQYTAVTPQTVIAENATPEQRAACGLDSPSITVTTEYTDGKKLTVLYGRLATGGETGYYGTRQGGHTIWLFREDYYQAAMHEATYYVGKTLLAAPAPHSDDTVGSAKLKRITLSGGDRTQEVIMRYIAPDDDKSFQLCGKYVIERPYLHAANSAVVSEWDTSLCSLYGATIEALRPNEAKRAALGFNEPRAVAQLTLGIYVTSDANGEPLKTPTWYNEVTHTLTLGNRTKDGAYYAMVDGVDVVYTVNTATVPWAEADYEALVNKSLFLRYLTDLSAIRARVGDAEYELSLSHGTKKDENGADTATLTATLAGVKKDEAAVRGLYQSMMGIKRVSAAPTNAQPNGAAALALELVPLSGVADTAFLFYPYSANRYLCVAEEGDRFLVKTAEVEALADQWRTFAQLSESEAKASVRAAKETSKKNNP